MRWSTNRYFSSFGVRFWLVQLVIAMKPQGAESGWKRPTTVIRGVELRSIEDTAVIELLLTRPERNVER